jgi:hypothetical protein
MNEKKNDRLSRIAGIVFIILFFPVCIFAQKEIPVIETETGFYYVVQKGDTLWDLSRQFSDSPWLWPDLWSLNEQIKNPHLIYPGQKIRVYLRKDIAKGFESMDATDDFFEKSSDFYTYSPIESIGFIRKKPLIPYGSIMKVGDNKEMISPGDVIFIKHSSNDEFSLGRKFFTYKTITPVFHPGTGEKVGTQHMFTGVVEITRSEIKFSVATVVKAYRTIRIGNFLTPYETRSPKIPIVESQNGLYGKIIASEKQTKLFGADTIVFIDKGKLDGARPGQFYKIYHQENVLYDENTRERVLLSPIVLGSLLVLRTEDTTSTVLINQSNRGIPLNSTFGAPVP